MQSDGVDRGEHDAPKGQAEAMNSEKLTVIEFRGNSLRDRFRALRDYSSFYPFLFRELCMKKFRGTMLGFWWLVIRPLVPTAFAIAVFSTAVRMDTDPLPYAVFYLSGFITWTAFHATVVFMPRTLLWMQGLLRRTYFPRLMVPLASIGPPLIEIGVVLGLSVLTMLYFAIFGSGVPLHFGWINLLAVVCVVLALIFGMSIGIVTSVVAVFFRDVVFSVSYFAQLMMFLTPVIYPATLVPEAYRWIVFVLNPMAKLVEVSRWSLTGVGSFDLPFFLLSTAMVLGSFALSIAFFFRAERVLGDQL